MSGNRRKTQGIKSDETLFDIIELLLRVNGAGVTEIARRLGIAKSTVHAHLTTMTNLGFVVKQGQEYHLGLKFFEYGQHVRSQFIVFSASINLVDWLANETGEMTGLVVPEMGEIVILYGRGGGDALDFDSIMGTRGPMHCTAGGKAILAHMPNETVEHILDEQGLSKQTENTITDRNRLYEELERTREQGYATNRSEDLEGLNAIGVPLIFENEVKGALVVSGPAYRMSIDRCESEILPKMQTATDEIDLNYWPLKHGS